MGEPEFDPLVHVHAHTDTDTDDTDTDTDTGRDGGRMQEKKDAPVKEEMPARCRNTFTSVNALPLVRLRGPCLARSHLPSSWWALVWMDCPLPLSLP